MTDRPDVFVLGRLLEALTDGPLLKTPLQQRAGLNYTVFQRYLDLVLRLGLVTPSSPADGRFELTPRGVEAHRFLVDALERIFGPPDRHSTAVGGRRTQSG